MVLAAEDLVRFLPHRGQRGFEPTLHGGGRRSLIAQQLHEANDKGTAGVFQGCKLSL